MSGGVMGAVYIVMHEGMLSLVLRYSIMHVYANMKVTLTILLDGTMARFLESMQRLF